MGEFVGEWLDTEDENRSSDVFFEIFDDEGKGELMGGERDASNGVLVDKFNGAGFSLHERCIN